MKKWLTLLLYAAFPLCALQHPSGMTMIEQCKNCSLEILLEEDDSKQFVLSLPGGIVFGEGAIVTEDGKVLKDTETYREDQHRLLRGRCDFSEEESTFFDGKLVVISSPGGENWYHWLFQILPRLKVLTEAGTEYDRIYLCNMEFPWQRESLSIVMNKLGIPEDRLFLVEGDPLIQAKTLIVPSVPFIPSKFSGGFPHWLKEFVHDCFLTAPNDAFSVHEKIYVSRNKASTRRIANEKQLSAFLQEKGFSTIYLEDLPICQQAHLFHHAKVILGPHGSGFANLVFSKPGTQLIEIDHGLKGGEQRSFYRRMCRMMDCLYSPVYPDEIEEEGLDDDLFVDITALPIEIALISEVD